MRRRGFLKRSLVAATALCTSNLVTAKPLDLNAVNFDSNVYESNSAQTIVVFLYGAASQLSGNFSNYDEITQKSQSSYSYFRGITQTNRGCWQEAGGQYMEALMDTGDMTIFRTCFSRVREESNNKAHGLCTAQNQKGSFDDDSAGIIANLAQILQANSKVSETSKLPFVMLESESIFYREGSAPLPAYLKPVAMNENLDNPYTRSHLHDGQYYTQTERDANRSNYRDFDAALQLKLDTLAQATNSEGKIKEAFTKRVELDDFVNSIETNATQIDGVDVYPANDRFAAKLETAVKILVKNPDTKMITMGASGLGGWDDHDDARGYVTRMESLFKSLSSAMQHLKSAGKDGSVNILVFGEFGRNVNLNSAMGWDHGNLQNLYVLGGKNYFDHGAHNGVVGETIVEDTGRINRLFLKPKAGSYEFEPLSIAATIYKIYGITNPEMLTDNYPPVDIHKV